MSVAVSGCGASIMPAGQGVNRSWFPRRLRSRIPASQWLSSAAVAVLTSKMRGFSCQRQHLVFLGLANRLAMIVIGLSPCMTVDDDASLAVFPREDRPFGGGVGAGP